MKERYRGQNAEHRRNDMRCVCVCVCVRVSQLLGEENLAEEHPLIHYCPLSVCKALTAERREVKKFEGKKEEAFYSLFQLIHLV